MRLVGYGSGERIDRVSILMLKILHAEAAGADASHFQAERTALMLEFDPGAPSDTALALAATNGELWAAEDQVRALRGNGSLPDYMSLGLVAERIQVLNDRRMALIAEINGVPQNEKLYAIEGIGS